MAVNPANDRYEYGYTSDGGTVYGVTVSVSTAAAGDFAAGSTTLPSLPKRYKMRQVHGVTADGLNKYNLECGTIGAALAILDTGTFTIPSLPGVTYVATGYTGEKWSRSKIVS